MNDRLLSAGCRRLFPTLFGLRHLSLEYRVLAVVLTLFSILTLLSGLAVIYHWPTAIIEFFNVGLEMNLWTWANVLVLAFGAASHAAAGWVRQASGSGRALPWLMSALVLTVFSVDDFAALHERADQLGRSWGGGDGLTHFAWIIPGTVFAILSILALLPLMLTGERRPRSMATLATICLFAGAIGLEAISGFVISAELGWFGDWLLYDIVMHVEELLEAVAAALFLGAGVADLRMQREFIGRLCLGRVTPDLSGDVS